MCIIRGSPLAGDLARGRLFPSHSRLLQSPSREGVVVLLQYSTHHGPVWSTECQSTGQQVQVSQAQPCQVPREDWIRVQFFYCTSSPSDPD